MPTAFAHAFVAAAAGKAAYARPMPARFWLLSVFCAVMPDLDVGLFAYGVRYGDLWGHRGMMHSFLFALIVAAAVTFWPMRAWAAPILSRRWWGMLGYFFAVTASHGVLDAFTNGGLGIAFFSPFSQARWFFPWTPIEVSPIGVRPLFSRAGWEVIRSELLWVCLPAAALAAAALLARRAIAGRKPEARE